MENGIRPPIQMAVDSMRNLCLGYTGEQNAQLIQIDVSKWQQKWPGASIDLMLALPGEKASYPAKTELQDGKLLFLPGYGDTQKPGHGAAYVVATKDGTHLAASDTVLTEIMHKGRGGDELPEAPEAQAGWVADVLGAAHRAEEAAKRAENAQVTDEQVGKAVEDYLTENPVEAPVQSVNGKTGAVQLSAADVGALPKDTPIPAPYTLPVASAETLGGVKVGEGLQMDGEKLGVVPDGNFELIETATIENEITIFSRSAEPNGARYNFIKLYVDIKTPAGTEKKVGVVSLTKKHVPMYYLTNMIETNSVGALAKVLGEINNNMLTGSGVCGLNGASQLGWTNANPYVRGLADIGHSSIDYLQASIVSGKFPVGTVIEIWGVRA